MNGKKNAKDRKAARAGKRIGSGTAALAFALTAAALLKTGAGMPCGNEYKKAEITGWMPPAAVSTL